MQDRFVIGSLRQEENKDVLVYTKACSGCMYGSYPEVSITAHFPSTAFERMRVFWKTRIQKRWPLIEQQLHTIIADINASHPVDHVRMAKRLENIHQHSDIATGTMTKENHEPEKRQPLFVLTE